MSIDQIFEILLRIPPYLLHTVLVMSLPTLESILGLVIIFTAHHITPRVSHMTSKADHMTLSQGHMTTIIKLQSARGVLTMKKTVPCGLSMLAHQGGSTITTRKRTSHNGRNPKDSLKSMGLIKCTIMCTIVVFWYTVIDTTRQYCTVYVTMHTLIQAKGGSCISC